MAKLMGDIDGTIGYLWNSPQWDEEKSSLTYTRHLRHSYGDRIVSGNMRIKLGTIPRSRAQR
jgi:hypothetical protein